MLIGILMAIISLFYFQIDKFSEYLLQFKFLSPEIIINSITNNDYIQLIRIFTSHLFHLDLNHYLINSIGLISQGLVLEKYFYNYSKFIFFKIIIFMMFMSSALHVLISTLLLLIFQYERVYVTSVCGLSAVLFGMQFIYNYLTNKDFMRSFAQVLIYITYMHFFVPGTSTVGHLSGLFSGMILAKYVFIIEN